MCTVNEYSFLFIGNENHKTLPLRKLIKKKLSSSVVIHHLSHNLTWLMYTTYFVAPFILKIIFIIQKININNSRSSSSGQSEEKAVILEELRKRESTYLIRYCSLRKKRGNKEEFVFNLYLNFTIPHLLLLHQFKIKTTFEILFKFNYFVNIVRVLKLKNFQHAKNYIEF
ncbi:hypothetical protein BpHYR1_030899 [Brachionus plicatilis]|uniref:Uncharacterized protein n=1 Tax=Brachionus plicatilis TaxID=10195 RepID=A0A3M7RNT7_BRAPC|nr:hypothetical protein BpHYR1_030899 [Brachionus plicatilis]